MRSGLGLVTGALAVLLGAAAAPPPERATEGAAEHAPAKRAPAKEVRDPYEAYEAGLYDQALAGFRNRLARQPESTGLRLAAGGSAYKLGDFEAAATAYQEAARAEEKRLVEHALYNLGNTAYRKGKLEDAIRHYEAALGLDPQDADAQFNLDFVRKALERRQQQPQSQQDQKEQDQQQPRPGEQPDGGGEQDRAAEAGSAQARSAAARPMTQEEADRYLAMLEEARPRGKRVPQRGQKARGGKDW